ncbi:hypothetical protein AMTR_s00014p00195430 [Amborella trichopoda]|uniref:Uncharacterized protein n=1 Tax=Amborella trichopoda TaxID=13333 RepID=W1PM57_AMBTC|nr:hypothetical protein AMTR_s00014p00195430 [Amborella trichopoda]
MPCVLMQPLNCPVTLRLPDPSMALGPLDFPVTLRLLNPTAACNPSPHQVPPTSLTPKTSSKNPQAPRSTLSHKAFTAEHAPVAEKPP